MPGEAAAPAADRAQSAAISDASASLAAGFTSLEASFDAANRDFGFDTADATYRPTTPSPRGSRRRGGGAVLFTLRSAGGRTELAQAA